MTVNRSGSGVATPIVGSMIQSVRAAFTSNFTTSAAGPTDVTGMTVTITPRYANSIIRLTWNSGGVGTPSLGTESLAHFAIMKGATQIGEDCYVWSNPERRQSCTYTYDDLPATTSATTYKVTVTKDYAADVQVMNGTLTAEEIFVS